MSCNEKMINLQSIQTLMGYAVACRRNEIVNIIRRFKYPDYDRKLRVSKDNIIYPSKLLIMHLLTQTVRFYYNNT